MSHQVILNPDFYQEHRKRLKVELESSIHRLPERYRALSQLDGTRNYQDIEAAIKGLEKEVEEFLAEHTFKRVIYSTDDYGYSSWLVRTRDKIREKYFQIVYQIESAYHDLRETRMRLIRDIREELEAIAPYLGSEFSDLQRGTQNLEQLSKRELEGKYSLVKEKVREVLLSRQQEIAQHGVDAGGDLAQRIHELLQVAEMVVQDDAATKEKLQKLSELEAAVLRLRTTYENLKITGSGVQEDSLREKIRELRESLRKGEKEVIRLRRKINEILSKIRDLDADAEVTFLRRFPHLEKTSDPFTLENIYEQLKVEYGKLKESAVLLQAYRRRISEIVQKKELPPELQVRAQALLTQKPVPLQACQSFIEEAEEAIREQESREVLRSVRKKLIERFTAKFQERGYLFITGEEDPKVLLEKGSPVELQTPLGEDYKVIFKVDHNGSVVTRFVKEIEHDGEINLEGDKNVARSWCADYKGIISEINQEIPLHIRHILEPDHVERIDYLQTSRAPRKKRAGQSGREPGMLREKEHP